MRERISRGKRIDNNEWIYWNRYGRLTDINGEPTNIEINTSALCPYAFYINELPVIREDAVGDYTGLTDKNGKPIFEGDIVKTKYGRLCRVIFFESSAHRCWDLVPIGTTDNLKVKAPTSWDLWYSGNLEVIGNIYDNLELLEVRE